ncbi:hypothetical protein J2X07_003418 [Fictibacillus barbaricus]|uniref:GtrA-like protein domain-containing protein n=1 Tax=Fictibacillus barbaricus TaxID=182136 RepID=A0ABU1U4L4_9BACL|nr:hypothetical protein [Fictibacillus barbaricus]
MNSKPASILLTILFCSLLSLIFVGIDIPFPSSILFLLVLTNIISAFVSIFLQRLVIGVFNYNYYTEKETLFSLFYKYMTLAFFGLNHFAQLALNRLPFLINKLFSLIYFAFLTILWLLIMQIYNGS